MSTGPYVKLVLSGTIDGVQDWSVGLACQTEPDATAEQLAAWLATVSPLVTTYWAAAGSIRAYQKAGFVLGKLTAFAYNEINTPSVASAELALTTPLVGTSPSEYPTQASIVHSLKTGFTGRHNSGRTYWPCTAAPGTTANRLLASQCLGLATSWAAFIRGLSTLIVNGTTTTAVIVPASGATESRFVSEVQVGDIVDTQRRRRDKYIETRQTASSS
jgi:hypothetical protein